MKYIIYARKSTEEDNRHGLSIEAQLVELREFAAKEKLEIFSGAAHFDFAQYKPPPFRIFAVGFPRRRRRRKRFELIQEYCTSSNLFGIKNIVIFRTGSFSPHQFAL